MTEELQSKIFDSLAEAVEMWERGELDESGDLLEDSLGRARENPYKVKFRTRVQLATMLTGIRLAQDDLQSARELIKEEAAFARHLFQIIQVKGTEWQKREATGDLVQIRDLETKISLIGQTAPEIIVGKWLNSEPLSLASLRGRVVVLEFWATWCKPCEEVVPMLNNLHDEHAKRGLVVAALTRHYMAYPGTEEEREKEAGLISKYIEEHAIKYAVGISEDEHTQALYGANGLPSLVLVDREGIVRYSYGSGEDDRFKRLLAECLSQ